MLLFFCVNFLRSCQILKICLDNEYPCELAHGILVNHRVDHHYVLIRLAGHFDQLFKVYTAGTHKVWKQMKVQTKTTYTSAVVFV